MKPNVAMTFNLLEFLGAIDTLKDRKERILVASGRAGFGKTTMMVFAANRHGGAVITANASWTVKWMLSDICTQLSIQRSESVQKMYESIVAQLKVSQKTLFLDEANLLVEGRDFKSILTILSMIYRIHDDAEIGVVFLGLERFPQYIEARAKQSDSIRAFDQRCVRKIAFRDCGFEDARLIADARLEVPISDEQLSAICAKTEGNIRNLITHLTDFERVEKSKIRK